MPLRVFHAQILLAKSVPSCALKMQSRACILPLRVELVGARNLPLRFDPINLAGASGAIPPAVTGGGDGPLSCDLAGVNTFFPPLPSLPPTAELDRLTGSRPQDDRPAPPKRSLGVMSREAKADSILSGRLKGSMCLFAEGTGEAGRGGASDPSRKSTWKRDARNLPVLPRKGRGIDRPAHRADDPGAGGIRWNIFF